MSRYGPGALRTTVGAAVVSSSMATEANAVAEVEPQVIVAEVSPELMCDTHIPVPGVE